MTVVQLAERRSPKPLVGGSRPSRHAMRFSSECRLVWLSRLLWEQKIAGSNPATPTIFQCSIRLSVRTPGFRPGKSGSIPLSSANLEEMPC